MNGSTKHVAALVAALFLTEVNSPAGDALRVNIVRTNVVNKSFSGIGFGTTAHLGKTTPRDVADVFAKRWREASPSHALVAHTWDWEWASAVPFIKNCYAGSEIWLTTVNFGMTGGENGSTPEKVAAMLERLVKKEGVKKVTRYIIDASWPGAAVNPADAETFKKALTAELNKLGLKIEVCIGTPGTTIGPKDLGDDSVSSAEKGLRIAERTIDAINAGQPWVTIMTWNDLPPNIKAGSKATGIFQWDSPKFSTRDAYYAAGLISKHTWAPSEAYKWVRGKAHGNFSDVEVNAKAACLKSLEENETTLLLVVRHPSQIACQWGFGLRKHMHVEGQYSYPLAQVPRHPFGDIPTALDTKTGANKRVGIPFRVNADSLHICRTFHLDTEHPEQIRFIDVSEAEGGGNLLKWDAVVDKDLCYYRVYRMNMPKFRFAKKTQIGSTVATSFTDKNPPKGKKAYYAVVATDHFDNCLK